MRGIPAMRGIPDKLTSTRGRQALLLVCALGVALALAPTGAGAQTASVSVSVSPNPTQTIAVTITASGTAVASSNLSVFVDPGGTSCAATAYDENVDNFTSYNGHELDDGYDTVAAGSFNQTFAYTPATVGSYELCAYLSDPSTGATSASISGSFAASAPTASVTISPSASAVQNIGMTITVSGTAEVSRNLAVFVDPGGTSCATTAYGGKRRQLHEL